MANDDMCRCMDSNKGSVEPNGAEGGLISKDEAIRRKRLFSRARAGDKEALKVLKEEYSLTALWDGKRLLRL